MALVFPASESLFRKDIKTLQKWTTLKWSLYAEYVVQSFIIYTTESNDNLHKMFDSEFF